MPECLPERWHQWPQSASSDSGLDICNVFVNLSILTQVCTCSNSNCSLYSNIGQKLLYPAADCNSEICTGGSCVRRVAPGQWCADRKGLPLHNGLVICHVFRLLPCAGNVCVSWNCVIAAACNFQQTLDNFSVSFIHRCSDS